MERPVKHRLCQVPQDGIGLESLGAQVAEPPDAVLEGELVHRGPRDLEPRKLEVLVDLGHRLGATIDDEQAGRKVVGHKANAVSTLGGSMSARFLTLFFALGFSALTIAADGDATRVRNVVLVHGAWADGSSWAKVIPLLEKAGLNVVAVQNPLTSLSDDVA